MKHATQRPAALRRQIAALRKEVAELSALRDKLASDLMFDDDLIPTTGGVASAADGPDASLYVFDEDGEDARAFDDFYHAYDEVHAKTRKFLLG